MREADAGLGPGHHGQPGAVVGAGPGRAPDVGVTDLRHGVADRGTATAAGGGDGGGGGGGLGGLGGGEPLLPQELQPLLLLELAQQRLGLGGPVVDLRLLVLEHLAGLREGGDLVVGSRLAQLELLQLHAVLADHLAPLAVVRRDRVEVVEERLRVAGEDDLGCGRETLPLVLVDDHRRHLAAHVVDDPPLAGEVGVERLEAHLGRLQLLLRGVVALGGLLGLLVEALDALLHGVDVGLGGRGRRRVQSE